MLVSEILRIKASTTLFTTPPQGTVRDAVKVMAENDIGSQIVMDHGRVVGILTFREVLALLDRQNGVLGDAKVSEIMDSAPFTADPHMEVMTLRGHMLD